MEYDYMLTTIDNPYDPFEQFSEWLLFDNAHDYNTCGYLDRVANVDDTMTQKETEEEIHRAMKEIISKDVLGIRKIVKMPKKNTDD